MDEGEDFGIVEGVRVIWADLADAFAGALEATSGIGQVGPLQKKQSDPARIECDGEDSVAGASLGPKPMARAL